MKVQELVSVIEQIAPPAYACSWDNTGLICGRRGAEVSRVMVAVDARDDVIRQAAEANAQFLLTHHPLVFGSGISRVNEDTLTGRKLLALIENGIACYGMHTSFDAAPGCMADLAAARLGLTDIEYILPAQPEGLPAGGIGTVGTLPQPLTEEELAEAVKKAFGLPHVTLVSSGTGRKISRAAVLPGSGKGEVDIVREMGAEAMVTGDITHHVGIDGADDGLTIIDAGHYGIEQIFVPFMMETLKNRLPQEVEVIASCEEDPFTVR